ncbi:inositol monophosphatase family protein [Bacillus sp. SW7]|uniref:inositol monophosphatase family protein n=1 Tax=Bacillus TaxID=1386 RepID=UPI0022E4B10D|nr:inositol monophosphatase family protein [Bacillus cereus group sp. BcHK140]MDA1917274.1 inositol monophosphatase [Bacillus cereus group sp. BcHK140]
MAIRIQPFCENLIKSVGEHLFTLSKQEEYVSSAEGLFEKFKRSNDWATNKIKTALSERYPHSKWSDSEFDIQNQSNAEYQEEYWVCDAIDGAVQFLQGIHSYAINLCLIRGGQPVISFVYDPSHQEFFHAIAGEGAFLNGKRIQVAKKTKLVDSIISTTPPSFPSKDIELTESTLKAMSQIVTKTFAIRMLRSVSLQLAYVACGRLDGYYEFGYELYNWIAGSLQIKEAGGLVSNMQGKEFTWGASGIIATMLV